MRSRHGEELGKPDVKTLDDLRALAEEVKAQGYTAIKTNIMDLDDLPGRSGRGQRGGVYRIDSAVCIGIAVQIDDIHARDAFRARLAGFHGILIGAFLSARTRPATGFLLLVLFQRFGVGGLFGQQRFAVRDGDLVIIGVDFRKGEEAVAIAAVIHECRLQRRLDARYLGEIDIAGKLPFVDGFKIEFLDLVSVHHHNAGFFRVGGIDKHFLGHWVFLHRGSAREPEETPGGAR